MEKSGINTAIDAKYEYFYGKVEGLHKPLLQNACCVVNKGIVSIIHFYLPLFINVLHDY